MQIAGSDANVIARAVEILNRFEDIDGIDLNCGCPVPKVVRQNAGSALLKDASNLARIVETIKKTSNKKSLSVKMRLGFNEKIPEILALAAQNAGADYIAVHGRTRAGGYSAQVDYEAIARAKAAVKIPVVANGDIDAQNAGQILAITAACRDEINHARETSAMRRKTAEFFAV